MRSLAAVLRAVLQLYRLEEPYEFRRAEQFGLDVAPDPPCTGAGGKTIAWPVPSHAIPADLP